MTDSAAPAASLPPAKPPIVGGLFLTHTDLVELTERSQAAAQIRWLVTHGWRHEVGASGRPKVMRAEAERHLLGSRTRTKELNLSKVA